MHQSGDRSSSAVEFAQITCDRVAFVYGERSRLRAEDHFQPPGPGHQRGGRQLRLALSLIANANRNRLSQQPVLAQQARVLELFQVGQVAQAGETEHRQKLPLPVGLVLAA